MIIQSVLKKRKSQGGSVAITALLVMIILGALGAAVITQSMTGSKVSASYADGIAAQYLAEAGIQHAKAILRSQDSPTSDHDMEAINKTLSKVFFDPKDRTRNYSVKISYEDGVYNITSIGTTNKAQRQVDISEKIYRFAVFGGKSRNFLDKVLDRGVSIYPSVNIDGDVGCNTNIHYGAYVMTGIFFGNINITNGNVEAAGSIKKWPNFGGVHIDSKYHEKEYVDEQPIPTVIFPKNFNKSPNRPLDSVKNDRGWLFLLPVPGNDYILENNNTYYTNGDLILYNHLNGGDTIRGDGTIFVNGDLILNGNPIPPHVHLPGSSNISGNITLIVNGNVILEPLTSLRGEVLVMATQEIWIGTGIGLNLTPPNKFLHELVPSIQTYPAFVDRGILLANQNIFFNNFGSTMNGSIISKETVTLYGNASIKYAENLIPKMKKNLPK